MASDPEKEELNRKDVGTGPKYAIILLQVPDYSFRETVIKDTRGTVSTF